MRTWWVGLGLALLATGCGDASGSGGTARDDGIRGEYLSQSLPSPVFQDDGTRLRLTLADGSIGFSYACNQFSGAATWEDGGVLRTSTLGGTEMGCPGRRQAQDDWMIDFFSSEPEVHLDGTDLRLRSGEVEVWFVPASEDPVGEAGNLDDLLGTDWTLTGVAEYDGDDGTVSSLPAGAAAPVLRLEGDEVAFSTGCNSGGGPAVVEGDTIQFGHLAVQLRGCPAAVAELESQVLRVLQGTVTWSIVGDDLRLRTQDGRHELVYRR